MPAAMTSAWVQRKTTKIGISAFTDSFTPRRFSTTSTKTPASSTCSFNGSPRRTRFAQRAPSGRTLKTASPPAAMEMEMVRT